VADVAIFYIFATRERKRRPYIFRLSRSSSRMLLPKFLINGLNDFDKTDGEYSLMISPLMIWLDSGGQRSRSHLGSSMWWRRHPPWCLMLKVRLTSFCVCLILVEKVLWITATHGCTFCKSFPRLLLPHYRAISDG